MYKKIIKQFVLAVAPRTPCKSFASVAIKDMHVDKWKDHYSCSFFIKTKEFTEKLCALGQVYFEFYFDGSCYYSDPLRYETSFKDARINFTKEWKYYIENQISDNSMFLNK